MWNYLRHPNVLPLMGVAMTDTQFAMVSEWMVNGNINDFVKAYPDVDRLALVGHFFKVLSPPCLQSHNPLAGRRRSGADLYSQPRNDPWGSQRGASSTTGITFPQY